MKSRELSFAIGLALLSQAAAMASNPPPPPATNHPVQGVSWQDLQSRCAEPSNFPDMQGIPPANIQIECGQIEKSWVPVEPGNLPLAAERQVAAAVSATKFTVASEVKALTLAATAGACPKFKEVTRTSHVVVPVDCGQVIGFKGNPIDFCQNLFDSGKGTGPKETVTQDTGRTLDTCGATPIGGDPKPVE
jgi:hypothetical protein